MRDVNDRAEGLDPEPEATVPPPAPEPEPAPPPEPEPEPAPAPEPEPPPEPEPEPEPPPEPEPAPQLEPLIAVEPEVAIEEPRRPLTVARLVAERLRAAGVRWAYTVPGESFLPLLDALSDAGIHVVATRHEGAAAFMADAHGQLTGRPAVCLATRAVGAANLAIGIHTARSNSSPMFVLIGQAQRSARGREGFQEVDIVGSIGRLAKFAAEPADAGSAAAALEDAIPAALGGRPGPAMLSLPEDLLDEIVPEEARTPGPRAIASRASDEEIRAVLHLLAGAERPVILAGAGVLRARTSNDLVRLAELLRVPIIATWRRGDVIPNDHPLYLGMTGYFAPAIVRERLERADAMLVLGSRLGEIATFGWSIPAPSTRWIHVDIEPPAVYGSGREPESAVASDARAFVRAAVGRLESHGVLDAFVADRRSATNAADRAAWEAATVVDSHPWDGPGVHPGRVIATLRRVLPDDAIVSTDAGNFGGWLARGFRFRKPGTFLGPTSGAMGGGLPAAVAAALIHRDRAVVALVGDGGIGMSMAEFETAVREGARVVVLVFDNERYGTIRMHQDREDREAVATDLGPIDFAAVARACGARGVRVDTDVAFEPALRQALVADRATLIHLAVDRAWVSVDSRP